VTFFRRKMKGREAKGTVEKEKPGEDGRTYIATELGRKQKDTQRFGWEGGETEVDVLRETFLTVR